MTDFSQFKTCKKYGFFNRNTPNDADIIKTFSVWKSTDFYCSRAILPFYPNVVPAPAFQRRCFAHIIAKSYPIRTVIQLLSTSGLICPSISSQREGLKIQPFQKLFYLTSKIFDFMHSFLKKGKTKKPLHRHQESAGALLSLQNDVLCNGFEIQRRDCCRTQTLANSTKTHRVVGDGIFS